MTLLWSTTEKVSEHMKPNHFVVCLESHKISGINFGTVSQDSRAWLVANRSPLLLSSTVDTSSISDNNAKIKKQNKLNFTAEERCNEKILGV